MIQFLGRSKPTAQCFGEDVSFKNGPLISPAMMREFMLPCYRRFTSFLHDHGIRHVLVDSDGDCRLIIPVLMEGGVTGIDALRGERQNGCSADPEEIFLAYRFSAASTRCSLLWTNRPSIGNLRRRSRLRCCATVAMFRAC